MKQNIVFKQKEGDRWYQRNKANLNQKRLRSDIVLKITKLFNIRPQKVLELGCANGFRLYYLHKKYKCDCFGIDCSREAIIEGKKRYKQIKLYCGNIDKLKFKNAIFDLVIINFVFHWIDRSILSAVVIEIDRVLKNGGIIILGDFYPLYPTKELYHHLKSEKIYTYKDDYSNLFDNLGYYQNVGRLVGECGSRRIGIDIDYNKRFTTDLLKKDLAIKK